MPRTIPMRNSLAIFTTLLCFQATATAEDLRKVTLRDKHSTVVRQIDSPDQLQAFSNAWSAKVQRPAMVRQWDYKIDLEPGDRWLYDAEGWLKLLSHKSGPDYQIQEPGALNKLLGIASADTGEISP
jgi:hypothetical protein